MARPKGSKNKKKSAGKKPKTAKKAVATSGTKLAIKKLGSRVTHIENFLAKASVA